MILALLGWRDVALPRLARVGCSVNQKLKYQERTTCTPFVKYFDERLGAAHSKGWSKSAKS